MKEKKYIEFLKSKIEIAPETGFDIDIPLIEFKDGTILKPHQRDSIIWSIKGGRRALFQSFGLGKTIQQLIICNEILKVKGGKALIVCPLGVRQEFRNDAQNKLGIEITYITSSKDLADNQIYITNYERVRDGEVDPFGGLMTVPFEAVKAGRKGIGIELNSSSYRDGLQYLREIESKVTSPTLFDLVEHEKTA